MDICERDRRLIGALQDGLPLVRRPYASLGEAVGMAESEVIRRIARLKEAGIIRRFGVIVRHHELGYRANAMMVWALPEDQVDTLGQRLAREAPVTLCYRRLPAPPRWPYNLYCMIHGQSREAVLAARDALVARHGLERYPHRVLFSSRRFKQRGARYLPGAPRPTWNGEADHGRA
ncbi:MAG: AsnC family transcriptional regulator [Ectothiorhodospiraceae bacterium]|nr:AsnC family transcriptional regulator [Ectothiorhodospiraceae bacterium]